MLAVDQDATEILGTLLEAGADPDQGNDWKINGLMSAALGGKAEMVELFLGAGADVNASYSEGVPVLWNAVSRGHIDIVRRLLEAGAQVAPARELLLEAAEPHPEIDRLLREAER